MAELIIEEQPTSTFRYRYKSELHGAHGHIQGANSQHSRNTLPRVVLRNCSESKAIIRCRLAAVDKDAEHPHLLVKKTKNTGLENEPHDEIVGDDYWTAEFKVGVIQTARRDAVKSLKDKYERLRTEKGRKKLTSKQLTEIDRLAKIGSEVDLTSVRLRFEALTLDLQPICNKFGQPLVVFSDAIANKKCAGNEELQISESSHSAGSCTGGERVMLFVNKVDKKNIKVRFFEEDEDGVIVWEDFGKFAENDVWHQYGIAFRVPPYKNQYITANADVLYQLIRPSDTKTSPALSYTYRPLDHLPPGKKRKIDEPVDPFDIEKAINNAQPMTTPSFEGYIMNENISSTFDDLKVEDLMLIGGQPLPPVQSHIFPVSQPIPSHHFMENSRGTYVQMPQPSTANISSHQDQVTMDGPPVQRAPKRPARVGLQQRVWTVVAQGDEEALTDLLDDLGSMEKKKLLDAFDNRGMASIHHAAKRGHLQLVQKLLDWNVDAEVTDKCTGRRALHFAVQGGHEKVVTLLVQESSSIIDEADWKGQTPLYYASASNNLKLCELLLDAEADPEASDIEGISPLHLAANNKALKELFNRYVDSLEDKIANLKL